MEQTERAGQLENSNVLEGLRCPSCGSLGPFKIAARAWFLVTDEGTEYHEDVEWDDQSDCDCATCGFTANVGDFGKGR